MISWFHRKKSQDRRSVVIPMPAPETSIEAYTLPRIKRTCDRAVKSLKSKRNPSPTTREMLEKIHEKCNSIKIAMKDKSSWSTKRRQAIPELRSHESDLAERIFYKSVGGVEEQVYWQSLKVDLTRLLELDFFCGYGDYFGDFCQGLRLQASKDNLDPSGELSGRNYWTMISDALKLEGPEWRKAALNGGAKVHVALDRVCDALKVNLEHALRCIHLWAARCKAAYTGSGVLLKQGHSAEIAKMLFGDLQHLDKACPPAWRDNIENVRSLIVGLRDKWFDRDGVDENDPGTWFPKEPLKDAIKLEQAIKPGKIQQVPNLAKANLDPGSDTERLLQRQILNLKKPGQTIGPVSYDHLSPPATPKNKMKSQEVERQGIHSAKENLYNDAVEVLNRSPRTQT
ncbi:hypothetical protein CLAFUW4_12481 [Fulvia fulva]|uniref:Uncharacterized protein n=1 Tax=Passalora fulva TaxID=5499 RepID=A0A9Q8PEK0_PASFU|nr:uncharacterized protein CLAFUR5_11508 [Fulvia fulva]KAK4617424.1 hypothetical protein CLAFUR4_12486 [Fulvia fulva]KAK4619170.1 hypothetical protein CLAFUR0_12497 [Fulvia fulva]UJO20986.1 hypothetical protein CLAFUR5_11508 [Fulvia fulva]WPV17794.1 hypothetical protein CLAFUW4_12481 [Fulvia fulva]WPV33472.1 hypothetical protein CLAFUW7_12488 [Fulvia fulva]